MSRSGSWQVAAFCASAKAMSTNAVRDTLDSEPRRPPCINTAYIVLYPFIDYCKTTPNNPITVMNSHRHTGVVDRIVLLKGSIRTLLILEEVDQRATQMLVIDANK